MILTAPQQANIIKTVVATFNASVGATFLDTLSVYGDNINQLYIDLANSAAFQARGAAYGPDSTNEDFATAITNQLIGTSGQFVSPANWTFASGWVLDQLNVPGTQRGTVIQAAVEAISAVDPADAEWGAARSLLDNRVTVATDFTITQSGTSTDVSILQNTIAPVTDTQASVDAAIAANAAIAGPGPGPEPGGATFTLSSDAPSITEGAAGTKAMTFTLTLDSAPTGEVTVDYATLLSGTALSGTDFVAATGTVTFAAGQTVANVSIAVNGDAAAEGDETVDVRFSGASLAAPVTGTGTILANDTAGLTVVLTAGTETPVLGPNDDTINTNAPTQLTSADTVAAGAGTDTLSITPTIDVAFILDDAIFTNVTGIDKMVILTSGTGAQTIITGAQFQQAFDAAGVDLDTTSSTGGMTIDLGAVTGPLTLTTHSTTGSQTITTPVGSAIATVTATSTTGAVSLTTGAGADVVTLTTEDTLTANVITTGAGNDTITILNSTATTNGNTITGGTGADSIIFDTSPSAKNIIVIGSGDSGITLASADSITGFLAANDSLKMGIVASDGVNYVEAGAAVTDFAAALTAANTALNGTVLYSFQWDGANGYLFQDTGVDGIADQVVVLVGIDNTEIAAANIIA